MSDDTVRLDGTDNYGKPRQSYADKLARLDDVTLTEATESAIFLSAWAANNPRSDYHWQVSACYAEAVRRHRLDIYQTAYDRATESAT